MVLLRCTCSADPAAGWNAASPTLFQLVDGEAGAPWGPLQDGAEGSSLRVRRVAFAAEGARLLLFTEAGELIAIGDGCAQQQLLSVHSKLQQQQHEPQQQQIWNAAAATVSPRFWADKSRRQRLRGACRIRVPHRSIVEVSGRRTSGSNKAAIAAVAAAAAAAAAGSRETFVWAAGPQ